jgi:hypothetical protein
MGMAAVFSVAMIASARAQPAEPASICYHLTYGDTAVASLADYIALDLNAEREARSGVGPGTPRDFWRMFLVGATWARSRDTLEVHFTDGFSSVNYTLRGVPGRVHRGLVRFHSDVIGESVPTARVIATPVGCASARLQSPEVTPTERAARREAERRQKFVEAERARLSAKPSPVAGTYRFELVFPGVTRPIVVFGRTERAPSDAFWRLTGYDKHLPTMGSLIPALGYVLRLSVAMDSATTSLANGQLAYFRVVSKAGRTTNGRTLWSGQTDVLFAVSRLVGTGPLDSLLSQASGAVSRVWFNEESGRTVGGWTVGTDDGVEFTMRVERDARTVLSIRGRRVSAATAPVKE